MLAKEISPTLPNHKFGEVKRLVKLGYTLKVKDQKREVLLFTINPPEVRDGNQFTFHSFKVQQLQSNLDLVSTVF